jgi:N4-gp56 family major capsid protein
MAALTEGVAPTDYRVLEMTTVDATLAHLGEVIGVTDLMSATDLLGTLKQATVTAGQDAALKADTLIRDELVNDAAGTSESDSRTKRWSGASTTSVELDADDTTAADFAAVDLLDGCTNLKINRAPQIDGGYVAVMAPEVSRDLMNDNDWLEAHKYSDVKPLYKGEAGSIHGVRVVEATNAYKEAAGAKGTHTASGTVFSTIITGANSYGVPSLAGDSPMSPKIVIADTPDKSDPLNQLTTIGFKLFYCAKALNTNWFIIHRSKSAYA